tara:strand:- start:2755 stop:3984 length:1230 start_codon:yes stop_codon:yes gene_type:complete
MLFVSILGYGQGLVSSTAEEMSSIKSYKADNLGFADILPFASSLEKYVPPVMLQKGSTCVGFATFYYGLSIMYNIKFNLTIKEEKLAHAFDPYFIYSYFFNDSDNCDDGLSFPFGFKTLKNLGTKKLFFPPFSDCETKWSDESIDNISGYTKPYAIKECYYLDKNKYPSKDLTEIIKKSIYYEIPVITGFDYVGSMKSYSSNNPLGVKSDGLWEPKSNEQVTSGHALCVIGYNDNKFGGAFKIVNSWGVDYGDNGYLWVKYDDFIEFVVEIYVVELNDNIVELPPIVIEEENYKRSNLTNTSYSIYEGQYSSGLIGGYGILSDKEYETYYIGNFQKGKKNGYFMIVDEQGVFYANYFDDEFQDDDMGFGSSDSSIEAEQESKKYFLKFDSNLSIRKANSGRRSSSKQRK